MIITGLTLCGICLVVVLTWAYLDHKEMADLRAKIRPSEQRLPHAVAQAE